MLAGVQMVAKQNGDLESCEPVLEDAQPRTPSSSQLDKLCSISEVMVDSDEKEEFEKTELANEENLVNDVHSEDEVDTDLDGEEIDSSEECEKEIKQDETGFESDETLHCHGPAETVEEQEANQSTAEESDVECPKDEDQHGEEPLPVNIENLISNAMHTFHVQMLDFMNSLKQSVDKAVSLNQSASSKANEKSIAQSVQVDVQKVPVVSITSSQTSQSLQNAGKCCSLEATATGTKRKAINVCDQAKSAKVMREEEGTKIKTIQHPEEAVVEIKTTTHRSEFMKLQRRFESNDPQIGPEMLTLWNGTLKDTLVCFHSNYF